MLVSGGAHDGPGMAAGNSLKHLEFTSVLQVNYYTFTLISVRTAKNHIESPFCHKRKLCHGRWCRWCQVGVMGKGKNPEI